MSEQAEMLNKIVGEYKSVREFCRMIDEDWANYYRWYKGARAIHPRAVIKIVRLHPDVKPYQLNPEVFPKDLHFKFKE